MTESPAASPRIFRDVLGKYPTGVAIVTAIDSSGAPVGMVVGTFTSVSLDPPLIGYLPAKSSTSFPRIRTARSFCVNILAADQEDLCRRFAVSGGDKFAGVRWSPALSGAPRFDGVAAWIDCEVEDVQEAGDHYIVLGQVRDLGGGSAALPLIFFQGGYGKFEPGTVAALPEPDIMGALHRADVARPAMERLSARFAAECVAVAAVADDLVVVASSGSPAPGQHRWRVGQRSPFIPPFGTLFVGPGDQLGVEDWIARAGASFSDEYRQAARDAADRARVRGWSVSLTNTARERLQSELDRFSDGVRSAAERELIRELATETIGLFEPAEIDPARSYRPGLIGAAVGGNQGERALALMLWGFGTPLTGEQILERVTAVVAEANGVSALLADAELPAATEPAS